MSTETQSPRKKIISKLAQVVVDLELLLGKIDAVYEEANLAREAYRQKQSLVREGGLEGKTAEDRKAKLDIACENERIAAHAAETHVKKFDAAVAITIAKKQALECLLNNLKD